MDEIQSAIVNAATAAGEDPAWALSVAERESDFDPEAKASKTIRGLFQMTKGLRDQYGIGDSTDPSTQATGFMKYAKDLRGEMASVLGRDPTPQELYAGHHFGGVRAARMIAGQYGDAPVTDVFTRQEMAGNPHFAKAGTVGNLLQSLDSDINKRMAKFGGTAVAGTVPANTAKTPFDYSAFGPSAENPDLTQDASVEPAAVKKATPTAQTPEEEPPQLAPIQTAMAPPKPQVTQGPGGIPPLPSPTTAKLGLDPKEILAGKPMLGGLAALMGNPNG